MIATDVFNGFRPLTTRNKAQEAIKIIAIQMLAFNVWCGMLMLAGHSVASALPTLVSGTVTRVIDGDTIWVQTASSSRPLKVRLQAIDAPEICQAGGIASRNALKAQVFGKVVTLRSQAIDKYSRTVATVDLQGQDMSRWAVRSGHAWSTGPFQSEGPYKSEQNQALSEKRGLFANTAPVEQPRHFRKRFGSCFAKS